MRNADAEARENTRNRRVGEFIQAVTDGQGAAGLETGRVSRITMRLPSRDDPEALVVVKASGEGGDFVAFIGGLDLVQALLTWAAKDQGKGLRWRVDIPWGQR